jgi:hypothetical protein
MGFNSKFMPQLFSHPKLMRRLGALLLLTCIDSFAQNVLDSMAFFRNLDPVRLRLLLPFDGPSASLINPAQLTSAEMGYVEFGRWGGDHTQTLDIAGGIGFNRRFYLGLFVQATGNSFSYTNAQVLQNRFATTLAYRHPLDDNDLGSVSFGIIEALRVVNLLETHKHTSTTTDLGITYVPVARPGGWRIEFGSAARDLLPFSRKINKPRYPYPDSTFDVDFAPWQIITSIKGLSPDEKWTLYAEVSALENYTLAYLDKSFPSLDVGFSKLHLSRFGVKYFPLPYFSFDMEQIMFLHWAGGLTLTTGAWSPLRFELNFRTVYGPHLRYQIPDETSITHTWALRLHW